MRGSVAVFIVAALTLLPIFSVANEPSPAERGYIRIERSSTGELVENLSPNTLLIDGKEVSGLTTIHLQAHFDEDAINRLVGIRIFSEPSHIHLVALTSIGFNTKDLINEWKNDGELPLGLIKADLKEVNAGITIKLPTQDDQGLAVTAVMVDEKGKYYEVPISSPNFYSLSRFRVKVGILGTKSGYACFECEMFGEMWDCGCLYCKPGTPGPFCCCTQDMFCEMTCWPIMCM